VNSEEKGGCFSLKTYTSVFATTNDPWIWASFLLEVPTQPISNSNLLQIQSV